MSYPVLRSRKLENGLLKSMPKKGHVNLSVYNADLSVFCLEDILNQFFCGLENSSTGISNITTVDTTNPKTHKIRPKKDSYRSLQSILCFIVRDKDKLIFD